MTDSEIDAVKRIVDAYTDRLMADRRAHAGKWMIFKLSDGSSDSVLYDTYRDAMKYHRRDPVMALKLAPDGIRPRAARTLLRFHRGLHERGLRLADPDHAAIPTLDEQRRAASPFWTPGRGL